MVAIGKVPLILRSFGAGSRSAMQGDSLELGMLRRRLRNVSELYPNRKTDLEAGKGRWEMYTREEIEAPVFSPDGGGKTKIVLSSGFAAAYFRDGDVFKERYTGIKQEVYSGLVVGGEEEAKSIEEDLLALSDIMEGYLYRSRLVANPIYSLGIAGMGASAVALGLLESPDKIGSIVGLFGSFGLMTIGGIIDPFIEEAFLRSVYYWKLRSRRSLRENLYGNEAMVSIVREDINAGHERRLHKLFERWKAAGFEDNKEQFLNGLKAVGGLRNAGDMREALEKSRVACREAKQAEVIDALLENLDKLSGVFDDREDIQSLGYI